MFTTSHPTIPGTPDRVSVSLAGGADASTHFPQVRRSSSGDSVSRVTLRVRRGVLVGRINPRRTLQSFAVFSRRSKVVFEPVRRRFLTRPGSGPVSPTAELFRVQRRPRLLLGVLEAVCQ